MLLWHISAMVFDAAACNASSLAVRNSTSEDAAPHCITCRCNSPDLSPLHNAAIAFVTFTSTSTIYRGCMKNGTVFLFFQNFRMICHMRTCAECRDVLKGYIEFFEKESENVLQEYFLQRSHKQSFLPVTNCFLKFSFNNAKKIQFQKFL